MRARARLGDQLDLRKRVGVVGHRDGDGRRCDSHETRLRRRRIRRTLHCRSDLGRTGRRGATIGGRGRAKRDGARHSSHNGRVAFDIRRAETGEVGQRRLYVLLLVTPALHAADDVGGKVGKFAEARAIRVVLAGGSVQPGVETLRQQRRRRDWLNWSRVHRSSRGRTR